jgi:hypothetical protein
MNKHLIAITMTLMIAVGAQSSLIFAAQSAPARLASHQAVSTPLLPAEGLPADVAGLACLRGARPCFNVGTENCCGEFALLGPIFSGVGAFVSAALMSFGYWYYDC